MKKIILSIVAILIVVALYFAFTQPTIPVTITEKQAQTSINSQLPMAKTVPIEIPFFKDKRADLLINSVNVDFLDNGKINVLSVIDADIEGRTTTGTVQAEAKILYKKGSFFLTGVNIINVKFEDIKVKEKDEKILKTATKAVDKAKNLLGKWNKFAKVEDEGGILEDITSNENIDKMMVGLKADLIIKAKAEAIRKIENMPVYSLDSKDTKHNLAKLMLKDIVVTDNELTIEMSIQQLISKIMLFIFSGILGLALTIGFLRNP